MRTIVLAMVLLLPYSASFGQALGASIQDAEKQGITIDKLDKIYKSAVNADTEFTLIQTVQSLIFFTHFQKRVLKPKTKFRQINKRNSIVC